MTPSNFQPVLQVKQIAFFDDRFYRLVLYDNSVIYLPSVTTVLHAVPKPFLAQWRGQVGNQEADRKMNEAMDRGTRVHQACHVYSMGGGVIWDPYTSKGMTDLNDAADGLRKQFKAAGRPYATIQEQGEMMQVGRWAQWLKVVGPKTQGSEMVVYSMELGVAGTLDYVHTIEAGKYQIQGSKSIEFDKTGLYVQDLKTGGEDQSYWMQIAAYAKMYELSTGQHIEGGMITYLDASVTGGIAGCKTVYKNWEELRLELDDFMNTKRLWVKFFGNTSPKVFDFPNVFYNSSDGALDILHDFVVPNINDKVKDTLPAVTSKDAPAPETKAAEAQVYQVTQVAPPEAAQGTAQEVAPTKRQPKKKGTDLTLL